MKWTILLAVLVLSGCAKPVIDASSDEALAESLKKVRASLDDEDRPAFDQSMMRINMASAMSGIFTGGNVSALAAFEQVKGLTGEQVIAKGRDAEAMMAAAQAQKDVEKKASEAQAAESARIKAEQRAKNLATLALVKITAHRMEESKIGYRTTRDLFVTIQNGTDIPLSSVDFNYSLKTAGRSIPWNEGEGVLTIDGGLEPGETRELKAFPGGTYSMAMDFGVLARHQSEHPEAALTLAISNAAGPTKEKFVKAETMRY